MNVNIAKIIVNQLFRITGDYCNLTHEVGKHRGFAIRSSIRLYVHNNKMKPSKDSNFYKCNSLSELDDYLCDWYKNYKSVKRKKK